MKDMKSDEVIRSHSFIFCQVLGETFEGEQVEKLLEEADLLKDGRFSSQIEPLFFAQEIRSRKLIELT